MDFSIEHIRNKVLKMEYELSNIRTLLNEYEDTKCPDKGDAIICEVIDKFGGLEKHSDQAQIWAGAI